MSKNDNTNPPSFANRQSSRREFLKQAGLGAFAATLLGGNAAQGADKTPKQLELEKQKELFGYFTPITGNTVATYSADDLKGAYIPD